MFKDWIIKNLYLFPVENIVYKKENNQQIKNYKFLYIKIYQLYFYALA
jgi:hypothetical protein